MPAGIAGDITRFVPGTTVETVQVDATTPPPEYGLGVALDATSHAARPITTGDNAAAIYGINVRPFPTSQNNTTDTFGTATPPTTTSQVTPSSDVLKRGYIGVKLRGVTAAAKNGVVYVWAGATGGGHQAGGIEAAAGASGIVLANSYFMGPADANGFTEIAVNI